MASFRAAVVAATLLAVVACASGASVGPLTIDVPDGWQAARITDRNLKLTDGTLGSAVDTEAGTATAVFDIFLESDHTPDSYRELLEQHNVGAREERFEIDGYEAVGFEYTGEAFAGSQYAVVIPERQVHIVYRAAFAHDETAFRRHLGTVQRAIRSIRFD